MVLWVMIRRLLTTRAAIIAILILQIVPLVLFPPSSFKPTSLEWWLPVLLAVLVLISLILILIRRSTAPWPWYLLSLAQGLNIISRLMMLMPHATVIVNGIQKVNVWYVLLTVVSMIISAFILWYCELPEVRNRILA